jgi:hypothetical protein
MRLHFFVSLFDDPDRDSRALYAKYWQDKLKNNKDISYPDSLVDEVASSTDKFSFAYLKEALFVDPFSFMQRDSDIPFITAYHRLSFWRALRAKTSLISHL